MTYNPKACRYICAVWICVTAKPWKLYFSILSVSYSCMLLDPWLDVIVFNMCLVLTEIVKGLWSCFFSCLCRHWCTVETMESMLNKLKSTVTKVTADVTSAVMGNPVTREFDVGRHIASGGNGLAWKIFNGTKKSTKQVGCQVKTYVYKH